MRGIGKTVESFIVALEGQINRRSGFARALRKPDREAFDELMDACRSYASDSSNTTSPVVFEPMLMSMMLAQQKRIQKLEYKLNDQGVLSLKKPGEKKQVGERNKAI